MADKNFTHFATKLNITKEDHLVGYDQSGTHEVKSTVGSITDLAVADTTILIRRAIDENNLGRSTEFLDSDGDFIGETNDLIFTASSIQKTINYNGTTFSPSTLSLLLGHNYDLDITSTGNNVAIRKTTIDNLSGVDEIYNNDPLSGVSDKVIWWTPIYTGTYYIVDINDTTKYSTITIT